MQTKEYLEYLASDKWHETAKKRMQIDGNKCCMCGSQGTNWNVLEVHHITYRSLGNEDVWRDLVTVCHACHTSVHRMMHRRTGPNRYGWKDELPTSLANHSVTEIDGYGWASN